MTTIDLPQDIDSRLDRIAARIGLPKSGLFPALLRAGIDELEDYYLAVDVSDRVRRGDEAVSSATEARARLGLGG